MSWFCNCGLRNSGLNLNCADLSNKAEHFQVSNNTPDKYMAIVAGRGLNMTEQEALFAQFFNKGKLLVKDMDMTKLREHREVLARVVFEGKAHLAAVDDELRERKAKSGPKVKEWTLSPTSDQVTSDAINAVKVRKERMSKMDKIAADLRKIQGMDEDAINEIVSNLERKATETNLKKTTFGKPLIEKIVDTVLDVEPAAPAVKKPNPFVKKKPV
jgi:hypothetical protein